MPDNKQFSLSCEVVSQTPELTLDELCRRSGLTSEKLTTYVEEGLIIPHGAETTQWRFSRMCLIEAHKISRLERDLGLNPAGVTVALELSSQIKTLEARLRYLEKDQIK